MKRCMVVMVLILTGCATQPNPKIEQSLMEMCNDMNAAFSMENDCSVEAIRVQIRRAGSGQSVEDRQLEALRDIRRAIDRQTAVEIIN